MTATRGQDVIVATAADVSRRSVIVGMGFAGLAAAFAANGWRVSAQAQDTTRHDAQPSDGFNAAVFVYNHPDDSAAFQAYLQETHLPLALAVPGIQSLVIHSGMVVPELVPGDMYQLGTVLFASQADLEAGLASEEAAVAMADLANFATGGFSVYLAHIDIIQVSGEATPTA